VVLLVKLESNLVHDAHASSSREHPRVKQRTFRHQETALRHGHVPAEERDDFLAVADVKEW
jgi:hypothetical protein